MNDKIFTSRDVTVTISTRGRYFTTLPLCIIAICNQTVTPKKFILFDDNENKKDLREESIYKNIFALLTVKNIEWEVVLGLGQGQVKNHQYALGNKIDGTPVVNTELLWRMDDDNIPESNVLENLLSIFNSIDNVGAVAGLVLNAKHGVNKNKLASNKIEDIFLGLNQQWFVHDTKSPFQVDHLYSTFLFRKSAATHGYRMDLSRVGHREETFFSYEMTRSGWKCIINPNTITWHFDNPVGGIRDNTTSDMWHDDEEKFKKQLNDWGIIPNDFAFAVLDCGIGDTALFKTILPQFIEKNKEKKIILSVCFPDLFWDFPNLELISIADAQMLMGQGVDNYNVYKWAIDHNLRGPLIEAFKDIYLKD
jgi:GT2 family glycosyltransferase